MQGRSQASVAMPARVRVGVMCHGEEMAASLVEDLKRESLEAFAVHGRSLRPTLDVLDVDVLLLWLAPGTPGHAIQTVASWLDANEQRVGIIGCAPRGNVEDTIAALQAGADDFVAGRCSTRELASRIRSLRQRLAFPTTQTEIATRSLKLNAPSHEVQRGRRKIRLSPTEVSVLRALLNAGGRTLTRAAILDLAWEDQEFEVGERAVDNVILRLRRKLGEPQLIETVRGFGFRLSSE